MAAKGKHAGLPDGAKLVASNRRARHDYDIKETFEAGLQLVGSEVKSLRSGHITLGDGYVVDDRDELWLVNVHIAEFPWARDGGHEPTRRRKLLLHRHQIDRIIEKTRQKGMSCIPLAVYFVGGRAKVEIGLGGGRRAIDKRHALKAKQDKRDMARQS